MSIRPKDELKFNFDAHVVQGLKLHEHVDEGNNTPETLLVVHDEARLLRGYVKPMFFGNDKLDFHVYTSIANTDFGPLGVMLFQFPDKTFGGLLTFEYFIDIQSETQMEFIERLCRQDEWKLVFCGLDNKVINVYPYENNFAINDWVATLRTKSNEVESFDFEMAKGDFLSHYSKKDLVNLITKE